jgi:hypothetical protein
MKKTLKDVSNVLNDCCQVRLTDEQVKEYYYGFSKYCRNEIDNWGAQDTCTRELICDEFSMVILNKPWPYLGSTQAERDQFIKDLEFACKAKGLDWISYEE